MTGKNTLSKSATPKKAAKKKRQVAVKKVSVKKTASKPKVAKKPAKRAKRKTVSAAEARYNRIAEIAYLKAEKRGFEHGSAVDDWLEAEREVDAMDK